MQTDNFKKIRHNSRKPGIIQENQAQLQGNPQAEFKKTMQNYKETNRQAEFKKTRHNYKKTARQNSRKPGRITRNPGTIQENQAQ